MVPGNLQNRAFGRILVIIEDTLLAQVVLTLRVVYRVLLALVLALFLHFCFLHHYLSERNHSFPLHLVIATLSSSDATSMSV